MTDEKKCEPPPELRDVDGWHWLHKDCPVFWIADQGEWDWGNDEFLAPEHVPASYRYIGPVTSPSAVAALVEALEGLMRWHPAKDTISRMGLKPEPAEAAYEAARAALAAYRGAGR